jgi:RNA polymerase sigma-70 factor (ECF subfamily)
MMTTVEARLTERDVPLVHDFDALFREEGDRVYRTLFAYTGGRADVAQEATAEAFARAVAQGARLRDPVAWIYRVAFNVASDELRRGRRWAPERDDEVPPHELTGVLEALRQLSPNQRAVVVLHHVLDLDVSEVAERMGVATSTVRVHLHRARSRLRELLATQED